MKKRKSQKNGLVIVLSAPSGCGKTTVERHLLRTVRRLRRSISATTRARRKGERHGRDYFFFTKKTFQEKIKSNYFLEWARVFSEYYGTPRKSVTDTLQSGFDILLTIDVQGARKIRRKVKSATFIFLLPPSVAQLKKRLIKRGTDTSKEIQKRLRQAKSEMKQSRLYDYIIVNDSLSCVVKTIRDIIQKERL
ncbi:MAG: guanylate kinase [Candidatus Omnitrophica bacterium]|nr:guanylate kinase [Candidatus Omnitrophota bacterium]